MDVGKEMHGTFFSIRGLDERLISCRVQQGPCADLPFENVLFDNRKKMLCEVPSYGTQGAAADRPAHFERLCSDEWLNPTYASLRLQLQKSEVSCRRAH